LKQEDSVRHPQPAISATQNIVRSSRTARIRGICEDSKRRTPLLSLIRIATVIVLTLPASAQWNTPAIDGSIGTGEYSTNNSLQNAGNTGQTWYTTWDATNLYLAVVNTNLAEGAVVYVGTGGSGSTAGNAYDGTNFSSLPFPAQFVTYFKDGYREYRTSNGGGWSGPTAN